MAVIKNPSSATNISKRVLENEVKFIKLKSKLRIKRMINNITITTIILTKSYIIEFLSFILDLRYSLYFVQNVLSLLQIYW